MKGKANTGKPISDGLFEDISANGVVGISVHRHAGINIDVVIDSYERNSLWLPGRGSLILVSI